MSQFDVQSVENHFAKWRSGRPQDEKDSDAFEIYSFEQILKHEDLSDEEIESGWVGGGDDGGIDGIYMFVNRQLLQEETTLPESALTFDFVLIQSKFSKSFTELTFEKFHFFTTDCFDWNKDPDSMTYYSETIRSAIKRFRIAAEKLVVSQCVFKVKFYYATKSDYPPDPKIIARAEVIRKYIVSQISRATVEFEFWDCAKFVNSMRSSPKLDSTLDITTYFATKDGSLVCLTTLNNFADFLTDESGDLKRVILEPNVRDYQGQKDVNKDIRATLLDANNPIEFWWLNNGITLIAEKCSITGNKITITKPEIVNGLQTSHCVFDVIKANRNPADTRNILLKIIVTRDERSRNLITKTTNSQTPVEAISLHATDRIHFDIQDVLALYGLFYDRRKGEAKRNNVARSKIVSMQGLAQAVIAILLLKPSEARSRPGGFLEKHYKKVFIDGISCKFYAACILLDKQVADYLAHVKVPREVRTRIRYYVTMMVACELLKTASPSIEAIVGATETFRQTLDVAVLSDSLETVLSEYKLLGATDNVSKNPLMGINLVEILKMKFPVVTDAPQN